MDRITEERLNMLKDDIQQGLMQADAGKLDDAYDFINELKHQYVIAKARNNCYYRDRDYVE